MKALNSTKGNRNKHEIAKRILDKPDHEFEYDDFILFVSMSQEGHRPDKSKFLPL